MIQLRFRILKFMEDAIELTGDLGIHIIPLSVTMFYYDESNDKPVGFF